MIVSGGGGGGRLGSYKIWYAYCFISHRPWLFCWFSNLMVWRSKTVWSYFLPYLLPNQVKASFLKFFIICLIDDTGLIYLLSQWYYLLKYTKWLLVGGERLGRPILSLTSQFLSPPLYTPYIWYFLKRNYMEHWECLCYKIWRGLLFYFTQTMIILLIQQFNGLEK